MAIASPPAGTPVPGRVSAAAYRRSRPRMVPLDQFGKTPPPPPRVRLTPRQIATYSLIGLTFVIFIWFASVQISERSAEIWSNAGYLDQRTNR